METQAMGMTPTTKKLMEQVAAWPEEDQEELAEVAARSKRAGAASTVSALTRKRRLSAAWRPCEQATLPATRKWRQF
jgi:hypothetical protein